MARSSLFRPEAEKARASQQSRWMGDVVLTQPPSLRIYGLVALLVGLAVILLLTLGTYTRRTTVTGQLAPEQGLLSVNAPQAARVLERRIQEGQTVKAGDVLFVLSSERDLADGVVEDGIRDQLAQQEKLLKSDQAQLQRLRSAEVAAQREALVQAEQRLQRLDGSIKLQSDRLALADATVARYRELLAQDYASTEETDRREVDRLDQALRLESMERERAQLRADMAQMRKDIVAASARGSLQLSQTGQALADTRQELLINESRRRMTLRAPESGIVTAARAEAGQPVEAGQRLVSLVPEQAQLVAHLYAPSRSAGFVKPGDSVRLRLQAYPYQKFGQPEGRVISISSAPISARELSGGMASGNAEPLFLVTVALTSQGLTTAEGLQPFKAGMLLEADLLSERRRLYEWALEPLYGLKGSL